MPIYTFRNNTTGDVYDEIMSMKELDEYLDNNPQVDQVIHTASSIVHERGTNLRVTDGFRETMSKIKERNKINTIKDY